MTTIKDSTMHHEHSAGREVQLLEQGLEIYESERAMTVFQAAKAHKRILLYCKSPLSSCHKSCRGSLRLGVAAFFIGAVYGYDSVANGATIAMPAFLLYFGESTPDGHLFLPSIWTSLWTAMSGLAQAMGGFSVGFVMDRFGRKWTAVANAFLSVAGVAVQYTSTSPGALLAGKMINGVAIGAMLAVGTSWVGGQLLNLRKFTVTIRQCKLPSASVFYRGYLHHQNYI
jgi:hypothetical protein